MVKGAVVEPASFLPVRRFILSVFVRLCYRCILASLTLPQKSSDGVGFPCTSGGVRVDGDGPRHLGAVRVHGALEGE